MRVEERGKGKEESGEGGVFFFEFNSIFLLFNLSLFFLFLSLSSLCRFLSFYFRSVQLRSENREQRPHSGGPVSSLSADRDRNRAWQAAAMKNPIAADVFRPTRNNSDRRGRAPRSSGATRRSSSLSACFSSWPERRGAIAASE